MRDDLVAAAGTPYHWGNVSEFAIISLARYMQE
jgi:hypothetical protein